MGRRSRYPAEFKADAVALARRSGRPLQRVADDLGVSRETLRGWLHQDAVDRGEGAAGEVQVAEVSFTAFASTTTPVTARLVVRRVRDRNQQDPLFPVWRHHPFFTDSTDDTAAADLTHRGHAIIEAVFADLIDGPLAHLPSGSFPANAAWTLCVAITHNLLRAAGTLTSQRHARVRGATFRRQIITVPARLTRPQCRLVLHLPAHWPWRQQWTALWARLFPTPPPQPV